MQSPSPYQHELKHMLMHLASMYISVVSNLLTSSRISSTLQVKIKKCVKTSGPSNGRSVVHPHGSHWMLNYFYVNATFRGMPR